IARPDEGRLPRGSTRRMRMSTVRTAFSVSGWLALAVACAFVASFGGMRAFAQTVPAVQSDPPRDAILTAPPRAIDLAFMDLVDPSGAATIRLVAGDGQSIA